MRHRRDIWQILRSRRSEQVKISSSSWLISMTCGLTLMGCASVRSAPPSVLYNPSTSAPRGWYLMSKEAPTRVGQYALARLPKSVAQLAGQRHYLPIGTPLLKIVAAMHGDYVCFRQGRVQINRRVVAGVLNEDSLHRTLDPWQGCGVLGAQQYFLLSQTNPASFDSRYFGPIDRACIIGRAVPLWTWP